jgi:putative ABC transport system permease protein
VASRTREVGIRLALGAQPRAILALVVGRGAALAGIGVLAGLALASAVGVTLRALLAGVSPGDPRSFGAAVVVAFAAAMAGSLWPAVRAARVDPAVATRAD